MTHSRWSPSSSSAAALGVLLLLLSGPAGAEATGAQVTFQRYFQQAMAHYGTGHYSEAIEEFRAAYALDPQPNLLINIGQAYRKNGQPEQALRSYQSYFDRLPHPPPQDRAQVEAFMAQARAALAERAQARHGVTPLYRRAWFWGTLGAATAAIVAGAAVAAAYPRQPDLSEGDIYDLRFAALRLPF